MRKIAGYLTKNRSEKDQKIAQSTHENRYIKPRKTFWRNSKQLLRCLRKDIHEVYVKMVDLSLIGETVLDWNEEDMNIYHKKRLEVDSLLSLFKSSYRSERIDSVCRLLAEKENLLNKK
ncbi:hypothetical protein B5F78_15230 [Bacteroides sp. An279]|nr:hypothetical protein B5F78_15230 [Bacteroides sp. An279]